MQAEPGILGRKPRSTQSPQNLDEARKESAPES